MRLLDHLGIARADVMGYSMGARITAHLALSGPTACARPCSAGSSSIWSRQGAAERDPEARMRRRATPSPIRSRRSFRIFAEQTRSDLRALAACMRGSRQTLSRAEFAGIEMPVLVSVGTTDDVAGSGPALAALMPNARALDIPNRDHNLASATRSTSRAWSRSWRAAVSAGIVWIQ